MSQHLVCPRDLLPLATSRSVLVCPSAHSYPMVDGIPIMLIGEVPPTHGAIKRSLAASIEGCKSETVIEDRLAGEISPTVQRVIAATCGIMYEHLVDNLQRYPIPEIRLPASRGEMLLDIGCNWGRWSIAAARKGYRVIGLDPDLGVLQAARGVAEEMGVFITFVAGDARHLPFKSESFDQVFSYSVLQHFSKDDVRQSLSSVGRVLKSGGRALIQMPNAFGVRSIYHQVRRGFRAPREFEVRYWTPKELNREFTRLIGPTRVSVDGFFGLGIQNTDADLMPRKYRMVIFASEMLRRASGRFAPLRFLADSLYLASTSGPERLGPTP